LTGTRKKGSFFSIPGNDTFIICEGFSTGVSLHEATGASVVVAFDAGNLLHVARSISQKVDSKNIIIAGDNDSENQRNIGAEMAEKTAKEIGCKVIIPEFKNPDGKRTTDFNDLHNVEGAEVVKIQVEAAEPQKDLEEEIKAIARLDPLKREFERNRIAKEYGIRKSLIDRLISDFIQEEKIGSSDEVVTEVEPSDHTVDGSVLLNSISEILSNHVILPDGAAESIAAWILFSYCYRAFRICPNLGIVSPVKRCGKTTLLEVMQGLVNKGLSSSNLTPAAVYRTIDKYHPTLLVDEADTFLKDSNELRGILNSGHTLATAFVIRVEGDNHEPTKFSTWGPKAVTMIGKLPDTLEDRSIIISLRRKALGEKVSRLDLGFEDKCLDIRRKCQRWTDDNLDRLFLARPQMPESNNDRMIDNWMPLFAIAEVAGGDWSELIKKSMLKMMDISDDSVGPMLLEDIREIFYSHPHERIFSDDLVNALKDRAERPWIDWNRGKGLTQNGLARLLKPFDVRSKTMRIGDGRRNGYELDSFKDAFKRYISSLPSNLSVSSMTTGQTNKINTLNEKQNMTDNNSVMDEKRHKQLKINGCHDVMDENGDLEEIKEKTKNVMPKALQGRIDPKLAKEIYGEQF
jgi:putative DNA primase/helicase